MFRTEAVQILEDRLLLASVFWTGGSNTTSWNHPNNWSDGHVPGPSSDVIVSGASVTGAAGTVRSLNVTNGVVSRLSISTSFSVTNGVVLHGNATASTTEVSGGVIASGGGHATARGEIRGGAVVSGGGIFHCDKMFGGNIEALGGVQLICGTLDGVTILGDLLLDNARVSVKNGLTLNGHVTVQGDGGTPGSPHYEGFSFFGTQTLAGTGSIELNSSIGNYSDLSVRTGATLTIGPDITVQAKGTGSSTIGHTNISGGTTNSSTVKNQGTIRADGSGISIRGIDNENTGTLEAKNGGSLSFNRLVNKNRLFVDGTSALFPGTLVGGTLTTETGAKLRGGTFDGVTIFGDILLDNARVSVNNGLTLNGHVTVLGDGGTQGSPHYEGFRFFGTQTLAGTGSIELNSSIGNYSDLSVRTGATLTIGPDITVQAKGTGSSTIGHTNISGGTTNSSTVKNQGTIRADGSGISIRGIDNENTGTLEAKNGGSLSFNQLVNKNRLFVDGTSALFPGTLVGGTLTTETGAKLRGGTFDGVTIFGDILLDNARVSVNNGLTLNGHVTVLGDGGTQGSPHYEGFRFFGTQTLAGTGSIELNSSIGNYSDLSVRTGATLTIGPDITVQAKGTGSSTIGHTNISGGTTNSSTVKNQGTIRADGSGISIRGVDNENTGTLEAKNGGSLSFNRLVNKNRLFVDGTSALFPGTLVGGTLTTETGAKLRGGTFDGVTIFGDILLDNARVSVNNGLTLNGHVTVLGDGGTQGSPHYEGFRFFGTQTLAGTGSIELNSSIGNYSDLSVRTGATLTIGPDITVQAKGTGSSTIGHTNISGGTTNSSTVKNQGTIRADGSGISIRGIDNENKGTLEAENGRVNFYGISRTDGNEFIASDRDSVVFVSGSIMGNTTNHKKFVNSGEVIVNGGSSSFPRSLEAMSEDRKIYGVSTDDNFYYNALTIDSSSYVELIDAEDNSLGPFQEVLYVGTLTVKTGAVLNLRAMNVYARVVRVEGTGIIIGGDPTLPPPGTVTIPLNDKPQITLFDSPVNYQKLAVPVILDSDVGFIDPDSRILDGGLLTATITVGGRAGDRLVVVESGSDSTGVSVAGTALYVDGFLVGSFTGGTSNTSPLVVTFNRNADHAAVIAIMRSIAFKHISTDPDVSPRQLSLTLSDGDGGVSDPVSKEINLASTVTSRLLLPYPSIQTEDVGYVDVQWFPNGNDQPVNDATIGTDDIQILNDGRSLSINNVIDQGSGIWRYTYSEGLRSAIDGRALPVHVRWLADQVRDTAGTPNTEGADTFQFDDIPLTVLDAVPNYDTSVFPSQYRKTLETIDLVFSEPVQHFSPADITLKRNEVPSDEVELWGAQFVLNADRTHLTIRFPISHSGMLPPGVYELMILPSLNDGALPLDGNGDHNAGDSFTTTFTVGASDLHAVELDVTEDHVRLGQATGSYLITNSGDMDAPGFSTHLVWSKNSTAGDEDDVVVSGSEDTLTGLAAGDELSRTFNVQLDRSLLFANAIDSSPAGHSVGTLSNEVSHIFLVIDPADEVIESDETNNSGQGQSVDADNITYFPWDKNSNGVVEPTEALDSIRAIATNAPESDFDGNGVVTPLEALSVLQRIGYNRNAAVEESDMISLITPFTASMIPHEQVMSPPPPASHEQSILVPSEPAQLAISSVAFPKRTVFPFLNTDDERETVLPDVPVAEGIDAQYTETVDWLNVIS